MTDCGAEINNVVVGKVSWRWPSIANSDHHVASARWTWAARRPCRSSPARRTSTWAISCPWRCTIQPSARRRAHHQAASCAAKCPAACSAPVKSWGCTEHRSIPAQCGARHLLILKGESEARRRISSPCIGPGRHHRWNLRFTPNRPDCLSVLGLAHGSVRRGLSSRCGAEPCIHHLSRAAT